MEMDEADLVGASERVRSSPIDATLEDEAWTWLRSHDERVYSFVDATSFAFMHRHRTLVVVPCRWRATASVPVSRHP